jgi:hypothetical protein
MSKPGPAMLMWNFSVLSQTVRSTPFLNVRFGSKASFGGGADNVIGKWSG